MPDITIRMGIISTRPRSGSFSDGCSFGCGCIGRNTSAKSNSKMPGKNSKSLNINTKENIDGAERLKPVKVTTVGDGMVGKTCMLITYTTRKFPTEYVPTVFDNYPYQVDIEGEEVNVTLWDTAGQEDYERLRPLSYPHTDCFLLCFSIGSESSFDNVSSKWVPELRQNCPGVPIVLVGTKSDLRAKKPDCISTSEGKKLRRKIRAVAYLECSAINNVGLEEVFTEAVRASIKLPPKKQNRCLIL